ncbi:hypothetical protein, partial [Paracoccus aestuariivivens]|uniref:hypothetical protein n=1 Tax=Paracoccus aestuariivivens TaxID=1820333 RepID=UPI0014790D52
MPPKDKSQSLFLATTPMTAMERTTSQARLIVDEQNTRRAELTASLRAQRLAKEADNAVPNASKPQRSRPAKK